jgi:deoxyribose-phosphate aldolase
VTDNEKIYQLLMGIDFTLLPPHVQQENIQALLKVASTPEVQANIAGGEPPKVEPSKVAPPEYLELLRTVRGLTNTQSAVQ